MPATSKAQQKFMGIVHGLQKGTIKPSDVSGAAKKVAKTMKKKSAKDFAKTKHKGLPNKVRSENMNEDGHTDVASIVRKLKTSAEDIRDIFNKINSMSDEDSLPSWWTDKITLSANYLNKARDFILNPTEGVDEGFGGELTGEDKKKFEKARKENAEQLGYKLTGTSDIKESVNERYTLYTTNKIGDKVKKIKSYSSRQAAAVAMGRLVKNLETDYFPKNVDGLMYVKEAFSLGADMILGGIASVVKKAGMRPKSAKMMGGGFKVSKRDKVGFKIDVEIRGLDKKKTFPLQFETERGMLYVVIKNKPIKLGKYTMAAQAAQNLKKVGMALIGDKDVKRIA